VVSIEADSTHNPARLSPLDPAHSHLKPLGFVDTKTLSETSASYLKQQVCFFIPS
jgi:hypothetical protein